MNYRTKLAAAQQSYEAGYTLAKIATDDMLGDIADMRNMMAASRAARQDSAMHRAAHGLGVDDGRGARRAAAATAAALGAAGLGAGAAAIHRHRQNVAREALKKKLLMGAGGAALLGGGGLLAHHLMSGHDEE